jgi:hypothetical protein
VGGFVVGVVTFFMALSQLKQTRKAAEAASSAATAAVAKMQIVQNLVTLEQLCARSRDLQTSAKGPNRALTFSRASELRDALARFTGRHLDKESPHLQTLQELLEAAGVIHMDIEKMPPGRKAVDSGILDRINRVHEKLLQLSGVEDSRIGDKT